MRARGVTLPIEVEAQSLAEVDAAIDARADVIMLDNLNDDDDARGRRAHRRPRQDRDLRRRDARADSRAGAASAPTSCPSGALTHSAPAADISLEMPPHAGSASR